ncbi:tetratricopeptide repeat protein [Glaciecola sp. XM2]|uniref:tetratricopeptide repeat protein n=1 Tax=Glaciecola sp. XM2 TaxID=1914931 RepID=UPI001BDE4264|nr:tetratricopeptide repeat protein [Glaciecola sp. XM2]MBT1450395.1 tetratricopeptide repeat protein [Glaciecola sp. XM2]
MRNVQFLSSKLMSACCLSLSILVAGITSSSAVIATGLFASSAVQAQTQGTLGERQTRRTPALRANVYDQLARAQEQGDAGNVEEAIAILDVVQSKADSMNSYERAMMHNFYGFIYYNEERYDETIAAFERAIAEQPIPESFEKTTVFSLAQLAMMQSQYDKVINYLERWESLNDGRIPPRNYVLKAQASYQNKAYEDAAQYIEAAIVGHEEDGYLPDENWLVLQRAIYFELKQPEKVKDIIAKLIRLYDEPKYWIQLAGMYGELEMEKQQLATMEIAYQRGFITSASDTFNLAQLYFYHGVPYKGAKLMEDALASGVLVENLRNLKFLGQSWQAAKEDEKAVPVMQQAATLSDDGEIDAQLALLYFNLDDFDNAIESANTAIEKGDLDNPGNTHMVLGLALYNKRQFALALNELAKAEEFSSSRGAARQWARFVEREKTNFEAMQAIETASE